MRPSRPHALSATALALALAGCWPFTSSSGTSNPDASSNANQAKADRPEADFTARADAVEAANFPLDKTLEFSNWTQKRSYGGRIGPPAKSPATWARIDSIHEGALAANPEPHARFEIYRAWASVYAGAQDPRDDELLMKAMEIEVNPSLFVQLTKGKPLAYRTSRLTICKAVRPQIEDHGDVSFVDFFEQCLEWAGDDINALWPGASKDVAKVERLRKEEEKADARDKAFHDVVAVIFPGGGPCIANACDLVGWNSHWDGEIESRCVNKDCYGVGWQSSTPYGVVNTRCIDEDCLSNGWKTVGPKGTYVATCTKGDCQLGWVVKKGGERWSVTRSDGGENNYGPYLVTGPKGKFECQYSNILKGGIECEETR